MKKKKILLIDDNKKFCNTLKPIIEKAGFELFIAFDGTEGIDLAIQKKPDLILLDIELPDFNGDVVLFKIKENQIPTRVIFITGIRTDISHSFESMRLQGISDYWVKGDEKNEQLINKIKKAIAMDSPLSTIQNKTNSQPSKRVESPESILNKCNEEAERNTTIYLIIVFVFLFLISSLFFYFWGVKYTSVFTIIILILSYLISAITLKEWTPNKLHERFLEIEKERIYKRFDISQE